MEEEEASAFTTCSKGLDLESLVENKEEEEDDDIVVLDNDDLDNVHDCCLLGYFGTRFPGKDALLQLCDSWKTQVRFHALPNGWIIFAFGNEFDCEQVLQGGPYFVQGSPLVLKPLPECFEFEEEMIKTVPVWIRLPGLPLDCWNETALSKIASKVGNPLCSDVCTSGKERVSFARALVEVDVSKMLVRSVRIRLPVGKGKTRVQAVVFERETGMGSFRTSISNQPFVEMVGVSNGVEIHNGKINKNGNNIEIEVEKLTDVAAPSPSPPLPKSKSRKKRRKESFINEEEKEEEEDRTV